MSSRRVSTPAPPGWDVLFTERGESRLNEVAADLRDGSDPGRVNSQLRRSGVSPEESAAILTQAGLRVKARQKFGPVADRLLFTAAGLEQATRHGVATSHATRFVSAGCSHIADLGCGIGAESLAMIAAGLTPAPVEIDPFTARIANHNLEIASRELGLQAPEVHVGDAERIGPGHADGVFLDPARRTAGHTNTRRFADPDDYSPSLTFAFDLASRLPTGIKLGPGLDRELLPAGAEAQWVSVDGQVVETGVWFGAAARSGIGRSALVLSSTAPDAEISAESDSDDAEMRPLGEYLYEPDGAVIRARLIGKLAGHLGAGMLSDQIAYLTSDTHVETPFAQAFRVLESLPVREKDLRRSLATRGIGSLEIKKRGADVDPASLRKRLKLKGPESATLFLTRAAGKHVALLAERC